MSDLISKKEVINYARKCADGYSYIELPIDAFVDGINALPSADADGEDLIIKGAKGIQDGRYNIKDGKLFKYKAKGGTVRTYPIVPSADAVPTKAVPPSLADVYKWERDIALSQLEEYGIGFAEKKRDDLVEVVRCKDCRHLDVWNLKNIYAVCSKHGITFEPFEDDTRTHFCSWGERREP